MTVHITYGLIVRLSIVRRIKKAGETPGSGFGAREQNIDGLGDDKQDLMHLPHMSL